jgi:acyl dehydratase
MTDTYTSGSTVLAPFEKTFKSYDLVAYSAATWDWCDVHFDQKTAESMGLPAPFVDGQNFGAIFAKQIRIHFGPLAFVSSMKLRFRNLVFVGDTVRGTAEITSEGTAADGTRLFEVAQILVKADGAPAASATTCVRIPPPPI